MSPSRMLERQVRYLFVVAGGLGFAALGLAQQPADPAPRPTFRAAVDTVTLTVTVLDRNRRPVRGLSAADFTVLDEGEPRPIVAVEMIEVPPVRPPSRTVWQDQVVADVVTNESRPGRLVVLFFDRSMTAGWEVDRARKIAARTINELGPDDLAAVVYNYNLATPINFTADRRRLLDALNSPVLGTQKYPPPGPKSSGDCFCGLCGVESLEQVAKALEPVSNRPKMVVYIGSWIPLVESPADPCAEWLEPATARMFYAAQRAQVIIHPVDSSGVRTPAGFAASERTVRPNDGGPNFDSLRRLAENTGGRTILGNNAPERDVPRLFEESAVSYLIGFTPRASRGDGRPQRVRVRVRGDDLTVLAASSYRHAPAADDPPPPGAGATPPPSSNARAIAGLTPLADIELRAAAFAVPAPGASDRTAVATVLGIHLPLESAGATPVTAQVDVTAFDTLGRPHDTDHQTMTLTPRIGATRLDWEVLSRLDLPKGRYEIRAAVSSAAPALTGSVHTFLDIGNVGKTSLAVSGLMLHTEAA
ncbi:MAG: VWA domain-containing protein, partial [Vicinamibacterales bacterium]